MHHTSQKNPGFTLVELLVVIAILGVLVAILLPALSAARDSANASASASNLSSFGRGFAVFQSEDSEARLCSGAFDHFRDGDMTQTGWIADLVNSKAASPGKALDPANRQKLNLEGFCPMSLAVSPNDFNRSRWQQYHKGTPITVWSQAAGANYFSDADCKDIWDRGFNTNYVASWVFVRGDNLPDGSNYYSTNPDTDDPDKSPGDGDGPLSSDHLATALTTADKIPLMGSGRPHDRTNGVTIGDDRGGLRAGEAQTINNRVGKKVAKAGDIPVKSFCDGPNAINMSNNGGPTRYHEMHDLMPLHGARRSASNGQVNPYDNSIRPAIAQVGGYAQMLFADLSVRRVSDTGGYRGAADGWIGGWGNSFGYVYRPGTFRAEHLSFTVDPSAWQEVRDQVHIGRVRALATPGGGSIE